MDLETFRFRESVCFPVKNYKNFKILIFFDFLLRFKIPKTASEFYFFDNKSRIGLVLKISSQIGELQSNGSIEGSTIS